MPAAKGEDHYAARLTAENVKEIRRVYDAGCEHCGGRPTMKALGEKYGVSTPMIYHIISLRSWKSVP